MGICVHCVVHFAVILYAKHPMEGQNLHNHGYEQDCNGVEQGGPVKYEGSLCLWNSLNRHVLFLWSTVRILYCNEISIFCLIWAAIVHSPAAPPRWSHFFFFTLSIYCPRKDNRWKGVKSEEFEVEMSTGGTNFYSPSTTSTTEKLWYCIMIPEPAC